MSSLLGRQAGLNRQGVELPLQVPAFLSWLLGRRFLVCVLTGLRRVDDLDDLPRFVGGLTDVPVVQLLQGVMNRVYEDFAVLRGVAGRGVLPQLGPLDMPVDVAVVFAVSLGTRLASVAELGHLELIEPDPVPEHLDSDVFIIVDEQLLLVQQLLREAALLGEVLELDQLLLLES